MRSRIATLAAGVAVLIVYLAALAALPKDVFWSPDEGAKVLQVESVHWAGGLHYAVPYRGSDLDPAYRFYPSLCHNEDIYPHPLGGGVRFHWPIWFTVASGVFSTALGLRGLYVLPVLGGWLSALLAGYLAAVDDRRRAPAAILLAGLGSPLAFYALCFWEHTVATACGLLALCCVAGARPRSLTAWAAAAPLLALAVVLRIELIAFAAALVLGWAITALVARRWPTPEPRVGAAPRRILLGVAAIVLAAAVLMLSLSPRHRDYLTQLPRLITDNLAKLRHLPAALRLVFVNAPGNESPAVGVLLEWLALAAFAAAGAAGFVRRVAVEAALLVPALLVAIEFSIALALSRQPYVSLHGVLPVAPYLAVMPYALVAAWRERRPHLFAVALVGLLYGGLGFGLIYSYLIMPNGVYQTGLEWGARNMLTLYPIGAALAVVVWQRYSASARPALLKGVVAVLLGATMAVGVVFQVRGLQTLYASRELVRAWQAALPDDRPIVTDLWWLAARTAPFYLTHEMYCVRRAEGLSEWLPAAAAHGVDHFAYAAFRPLRAKDISALPVRIVGGESSFVQGLQVQDFTIER